MTKPVKPPANAAPVFPPGWRVFPVKSDTKEPAIFGWAKEATDNRLQIEAWQIQFPDCNWGLACGPSDISVVDVDGETGEYSLEQFELEQGPLPKTREHSTPRGGRHLIYHGDIASTVAKLGPKLDTRGRGGYILIPPSTFEDKPYVVLEDRPIADLPAFVAEAAGPQHEPRQAPPGTIRDAPDNVARAEAYVKGLIERDDVAIEHQGGDDRTYRLATFLMDHFALNPEKTLEVMLPWNEACQPPFSIDEFRTKVENASRYMQNEPGASAVRPVSESIPKDILDKLVAESIAGTDVRPAFEEDHYEWRFETYNAAEDAQLPPITYHDENKLWPNIPGGSLTQIIAQAKGYKTAFYLSELFRLATMPESGIKVLIIAAEGAYGLRSKRIPALCRHYGIAPERIAGRFDILKVTKGGAIDFSKEECVRAVARFARSRGYTHIVPDTQNRVSFGLEENSAKDMGLLMTHLELLKDLTRADIVSIHHKGADPKSERGRGSSVQEASFDQVIEVKRDRAAQTVMVEVKFRKDGPDGFRVPFKQIGGRGEDAPPLLEPMSWADYKAAEAVSDTLAARNVSRALLELKAQGRANAVTSRVVVHQIHESRGTLPDDPEARDKFLRGQVTRLNERTGWDRYSGMCERDGTGKTAPWVWFLPGLEGGEQ